MTRRPSGFGSRLCLNESSRRVPYSSNRFCPVKRDIIVSAYRIHALVFHVVLNDFHGDTGNQVSTCTITDQRDTKFAIHVIGIGTHAATF